MKKVLLLALILFSESALCAGVSGSKLNFKTSFGNCPKKSAGTFALDIYNTFEKTRSLRQVKKKIITEKLTDKHFVSHYTIKFDPMQNLLELSLECPAPFMNVQFYKDNGLESYNAILVENGELYDPTYETLLTLDNKLKKKLPFLALPDPVGELESGVKKQIEAITKVIKTMTPSFRNYLSEVIIDEKGELTVILAIQGRTASAFFGTDDWCKKVSHLERTVNHLADKKRIPAIINLIDIKKIVVKFNE